MPVYIHKSNDLKDKVVQQKFIYNTRQNNCTDLNQED